MRVEDEENEEGSPSRRAKRLHAPLQDEFLGAWDWILALLLTVLVGAGLTYWAFPGLNPAGWQHAAEMAGLRPCAEICPGLWRLLARGLCGLGDPSEVMVRAGCLCSALTAGAVYLLLKCVIRLMVRGRFRSIRMQFFVQRLAALSGALMFACADPVWTCGQSFGPTGFVTLLLSFSLVLFATFMLNGRLFAVYASHVGLGLLAAETPFGFVALALVWWAYRMALRREALGRTVPLLDPLMGPIAMWCLTVSWVAGFGAGLAANGWSFASLGGLGAAGTKMGGLAAHYLANWVGQATGCATPLGAVLFGVVCVLPFAVTMGLLPNAVDEDLFLPYRIGAVFCVFGFVAVSQLSMVDGLHFWKWSAAAGISSVPFLHFALLLNAATVAFSLTVLGCDTCCRNHRRLANFVRSDETGSLVAAPIQSGRRIGRVIFLVVTTGLLATSVPGVRQESKRTLLAIVEDFLQETLRECGDAKIVLTDGSCDARLELLAQQTKRRLIALPVGLPESPYLAALCARVDATAEDRALFREGRTAGVLRSWIRDCPDRLASVAVQRGFELWRREAKKLPDCSGVLMRPAGSSAEERTRGVSVATNLAARVCAYYKAEGRLEPLDEATRTAFLSVQWRLARLARLRAEAADRRHDVVTARWEQNVADGLDGNNEVLRQVLEQAESQRARALKQMTPREGLQLALARADFNLASRYAAPILADDPDQPDANFGMGMNFYQQRQYARAEYHLLRCLLRKPKEPAVWNNLAMAQLRDGRLAAAAESAQKARALAPDSSEVADTIRQIEAARKKPAEKKPRPAEAPEKI